MINQLKRFLKKTLGSYFTRFSQVHGIVFSYHLVDDYSSKGGPYQYSVSPEEFEKHIKLIKKNFQVVSLSRLFECQRQTDSKPFASITFDDGYKDNIEYAAPILQKYDIPASFFVTTSFINDNNPPYQFELYELIAENSFLKCPFLDHEGFNTSTTQAEDRAYSELKSHLHSLSHEKRMSCLNQLKLSNSTEFNSSHLENLMMGWKDLRTLSSDPLFSIESHSHYHVEFSGLSRNELQKEVTSSKRLLEKKLNSPVRYFAYPHGISDRTSRRFLKHSSFEAAFGTGNRLVKKVHRNNCWNVPRVANFGEEKTTVLAQKVMELRSNKTLGGSSDFKKILGDHYEDSL